MRARLVFYIQTVTCVGGLELSGQRFPDAQTAHLMGETRYRTCVFVGTTKLSDRGDTHHPFAHGARYLMSGLVTATTRRACHRRRKMKPHDGRWCFIPSSLFFRRRT